MCMQHLVELRSQPFAYLRSLLRSLLRTLLGCCLCFASLGRPCLGFGSRGVGPRTLLRLLLSLQLRLLCC